MDSKNLCLGLALFVVIDTMYINSSRIRSQYARDSLDSFSLEEFREDYRLPKDAFDFLIRILRPHWKGVLDIETCVLMFLFEIGSGDTYRALGSRFGISKSSARKYTIYVARLINCHLKHFVSYELAPEDVAVQKYLFNNHYNQPDAIAAMDGVFLPIQRPVINGEAYYSGHKKRYGMMMLAVCDFDCRFLYVVCGNSSRVGDSLVFNCCKLKEEIEYGNTVFNEESRILVDSAFSDLEYLIKSTVRIGSGSARTRIEHAFGQFKQQNRLFMTRSF